MKRTLIASALIGFLGVFVVRAGPRTFGISPRANRQARNLLKPYDHKPVGLR